MEDAIQALTELSDVDGELAENGSSGGGRSPALEKRRAAIRGAISSTLLEDYDVLNRLGSKPVVVPMRGAYCGGCSLRLPPQLGSAVRQRQALALCPHCHRFLFAPAAAPDRVAAAKSRPAPEEKKEPAPRPRSRTASGRRRTARVDPRLIKLPDAARRRDAGHAELASDRL